MLVLRYRPGVTRVSMCLVSVRKMRRLGRVGVWGVGVGQLELVLRI